MSRLLAVTAVAAEVDAVLRDLPPGHAVTIGHLSGQRTDTDAGVLDVVAAGVGPVAAAAATATALALGHYDGVLSLGVAGGFEGRAAIGDVVVASQVLAADLGVDAPEGFTTLGEMGLADTGLATAGQWDLVAERLVAAGLPVRTGLVLTLSTVTGTDERAAALAERWHPVAEAMEGYGVWSAARAHPVIPYEVRTVSNLVGRRDRSAWRLDEALDVLSRACAVLFSEPLP